MNKEDIKREIEKVQKQLQYLKEQLAAKSLSDPIAREKINDASEDYRKALFNAGLTDIGYAFGAVAAIGKYKDRGIFLTNSYNSRSWAWAVKYDVKSNSEMLVRVDKLTDEVID